jgi:hypothetical protein
MMRRTDLADTLCRRQTGTQPGDTPDLHKIISDHIRDPAPDLKLIISGIFSGRQQRIGHLFQIIMKCITIYLLSDNN